jgi:signal peptidase I
MNPGKKQKDEAHAVKCQLAAEVLRAEHRLKLKVTGWSMLPSIWPGDTLFIEHSDASKVSEGDIVLFDWDQRLVAHRIVAKSASLEHGSVVTRGDCMRINDPEVAPGKILGKVSLIMRNGKYVEPRRALRISQRAVAALIRHSETATRVLVGIHNFRLNS